MSELQQQVCEQARASTTWKYKLGFTCEKCEMKWEIEHHVRDIDATNSTTDVFIDTSFIRPVPKCMCNQKENKTDKIENANDKKSEVE